MKLKLIRSLSRKKKLEAIENVLRNSYNRLLLYPDRDPGAVMAEALCAIEDTLYDREIGTTWNTHQQQEILTATTSDSD